MPQNNGTMRSPYVDQAAANELALSSAVALGRVKRSPFIGDPVPEPEEAREERRRQEAMPVEPPDVTRMRLAEEARIIQEQAARDERQRQQEEAEALAYVSQGPAEGIVEKAAEATTTTKGARSERSSKPPAGSAGKD